MPRKELLRHPVGVIGRPAGTAVTRWTPPPRESTGYNTRVQIMPVLELMTSSGLGSLLGMRHALEPDHLAAVSTLVTGERNSVKAALLGVCWGLGHTFVADRGRHRAGVLRAEMPARVADGFEFCVALMLIGLGLRAIYLAARQGAAGPAHVASSRPHGPRAPRRAGAHPHRHVDAGAAAAARRRGARPGGQRRADRARADDAAVHGGAAHLHGRVRAGIDAGDGRAVGTARLAAGASRPPPRPRARAVARRRLRRRPCSAWRGATRCSDGSSSRVLGFRVLDSILGSRF